MRSILNTSRVAIVGMGQLGGSLAKQFRDAGAREVFGIARRPETLQYAIDHKLIDAGSTEPADILPVVDLAFLCLPLQPSIDFTLANLAHFRPGSIVTDVGSVKGPLVRALRQPLHDRGVYFIGGHPMAGSEKSGIERTRADLYRGAVVFLTPTADDETDAITLVANIWRAIGANPIELSADRHDAAVAYSSHLLHLLAAVLTDTVLLHPDGDAHRLAAAGGFRDMSRIAASNVDMWTSIFRLNKPALLESLDRFETDLASYRSLVESDDFDGLAARLAAARDARESWFEEYSAARALPSPSPAASESSPNAEG